MSDSEKITIEKSELEDLIEEKVEEKMKAHRENSIKVSNEGYRNISRGDFLKKVGIGSLGLGALLSPVSADYFIKDDSFSVQTGTGPSDLGTYFSVGQGGPVKTQNSDFIVENSTGQEILQVPVYQSTSDLPSKPEGSIAYVKDDKQLYVEDGA